MVARKQNFKQYSRSRQILIPRIPVIETLQSPESDRNTYLMKTSPFWNPASPIFWNANWPLIRLVVSLRSVVLSGTMTAWWIKRTCWNGTVKSIVTMAITPQWPIQLFAKTNKSLNRVNYILVSSNASNYYLSPVLVMTTSTKGEPLRTSSKLDLNSSLLVR